MKMKFSEFKKKFGEGTDFDLDYGKLVILGLCIYIAIKVSEVPVVQLDRMSVYETEGSWFESMQARHKEQVR